jgi:Phage phiEco32-like COOH.NH2 ligase-type 2
MSVELQKLRSELMRECLLNCWTRPADVQAPWTQLVEPARMERWFKRLYTPITEPLVGGGRLINHFMLGADPEFVFTDGNQRYDARDVGLRAGPAFGADNNGRLVELRAAPSRHALAVLASMWLALRWMPIFYPDVLRFVWRAGSYYASDGLGGHVHFGRKRLKLRDREVAVLDRLSHLMFQAGLFDREEGRLRVQRAQGAPAGHPYGALGDVRSQAHGYEYRTLPSWIDNPWLAYFVLVASKLVVQRPEYVAPLAPRDHELTAEQARNQLRLLLAYYAPLDDDARLAFAILMRQGPPRHGSGQDLKPSWGIYSNNIFGTAPQGAPDVLPTVIEPTPEDLRELADSMLTGRLPEELPLRANWAPLTLPSGYVHAIRHVDTKVSPNMGELMMNYAMHQKLILKVQNPGGFPYLFRLPEHTRPFLRDVVARFGADALQLAGGPGVMMVNCSKDISQTRLREVLDAVVSTNCLPLWPLDKVEPGSLKAHADLVNNRPGPKSPAGTVRILEERG